MIWHQSTSGLGINCVAFIPSNFYLLIVVAVVVAVVVVIIILITITFFTVVEIVILIIYLDKMDAPYSLSSKMSKLLSKLSYCR